jgi:hypothetical protein
MNSNGVFRMVKIRIGLSRKKSHEIIANSNRVYNLIRLRK